MAVTTHTDLMGYLFDQFDDKIYLANSNLCQLLEIDKSEAEGQLTKKCEKTLYETVNSDNTTPFPIEIDDLLRLHYLITSRKVLTIMEFGTGKSSSVLANALLSNRKAHYAYVKENIRRAHAFELHSIDDDENWLNHTRENFPDELKSLTHFHLCPTEVSTFNHRLCTYYTDLPNVCPDLIYLDGPSQFSPRGSVRGLNTADTDRMPMAADILVFEHFLTPGTLIVVDGRSANARFLCCNLQREWAYQYSEAMDQHFFELKEEPLGIYNKKQLEFSLGANWQY